MVNYVRNMVNQAYRNKRSILELLRADSAIQSGPDIADRLGMSRVGVWKHIEGLRSSGYDIRSDHGGYALSGSEDFLYPWEFPGREERIIHYQHVDSTMDKALSLALEKPQGPWIVLAESQGKGRGRLGRSWQSAPGGLFFTLVLDLGGWAHAVQASTGGKPAGLGPRRSALPLLAAGLALCRALRRLGAHEVSLEWPNDLYVQGKKIAGILPEFLVSGESISLYTLGLGVNIKNHVDMRGGIELASVIGARASRRDCLRAFLDEFDALQGPAFNDLLICESWWEFSSSKGKSVLGEDGSSLGRAVGLEAPGRLLIESASGRHSALSLGEAYIAQKERSP